MPGSRFGTFARSISTPVPPRLAVSHVEQCLYRLQELALLLLFQEQGSTAVLIHDHNRESQVVRFTLAPTWRVVHVGTSADPRTLRTVEIGA